MISSSFTSAISGIQASFGRQSSTAHNLANVNTPGFEEQRVNLSESQPGVQISSISRVSNPNPQYSGTDIAENMVNMTLDSTALKSNASVIKTQDKMLGDLMDILA